MKRMLALLAVTAAIVTAGCESQSYDDKKIWESIDSIEKRLSDLEAVMNAYESGTTIKSVTSNGNGWVITFSDGKTVTISNGTNGTDGEAGHTPAIGTKLDVDGVRYWTVDDEWLTDENGDKIAVEGVQGADGVTPKLKIEGGDWYVSLDGGESWENLGQATGDPGLNGEDGDAFIADVEVGENYVYFLLTDGTTFNIPIYNALSITFDESALVKMDNNSTREIGYVIESELDNVTIYVTWNEGVKAKVVEDAADAKKGKIHIESETIDPEYSQVLVLVSNDEKTIVRKLSFEEDGIRITNGTSQTVAFTGGEVEVKYVASVDNCEAVISDEGKDWITLSETRALDKSGVFVFNVAFNQPNEEREATITVKADGYNPVVYTIKQSDGKAPIEIKDANFKSSLLSCLGKPQGSDSQITVYDAYVLEEMNVSNKGKNDNEKIESLEGIEHFPNITFLDCSHNKLTELNLEKNPELVYVYAGDNELETLTLAANTKLESLCVENNLLTNITLPATDSALKELRIDNNRFTGTLALTTQRNLVYLSCSSNELTGLTITTCTKLEVVDCSHNKITTLTIANLTALQYLSCYDNALTNITFRSAAQTALKRMSCANNKLTALGANLSKYTELEYLDCSNNALTALDVSSNTKLLTLDCSHNNLSALDLTKNTALTTLACYNNALTALDASSCPSLKSLWCYDNVIATLTVSNNAALTELFCKGNSLTKLDLTKTNLGASSSKNPLWCTSNPLTEITLKTGWNNIPHLQDTQYVPSTATIKYQ